MNVDSFEPGSWMFQSAAPQEIELLSKMDVTSSHGTPLYYVADLLNEDETGTVGIRLNLGGIPEYYIDGHGVDQTRYLGGTVVDLIGSQPSDTDQISQIQEYLLTNASCLYRYEPVTTQAFGFEVRTHIDDWSVAGLAEPVDITPKSAFPYE